MSCIASINPKFTRAQLKEIEQQKLAYSSPSPRDSQLVRLAALAADPNPKIRERAALDPRIHAKLEYLLAADKDAGVRGALARNTLVDPATLVKLSQDAEYQVRGFTVLNPACPKRIIQNLLADTDERVRGLAIWRTENT